MTRVVCILMIGFVTLVAFLAAAASNPDPVPGRTVGGHADDFLHKA